MTLTLQIDGTWLAGMSNHTVGRLVDMWLDSFQNESTAHRYRNCMARISNEGFINFDMKAHNLKHAPLETILDSIKAIQGLAESTRQTVASSFISFMRWLHRTSGGAFRVPIAKKTGSDRTFFTTREKVKAQPITDLDFKRLLAKLNGRDQMIALLLRYGARRISEVLNLNVEDPDLEKHEVRYRITKSRGELKEVVTYIGPKLSKRLENYIRETKDVRVDNALFLSRSGDRCGRVAFHIALTRACESIGIRPISSHSFRTSWITKRLVQGCSLPDIRNVTGHTGVGTILRYDRRSERGNLTRHEVYE